MRVLVGCEESQRICQAFRNKRHEAFSCDLQPTRGNRPDWHYQCDVRNCEKMDWDLGIFNPPCDHLAVSGARWFPEKRADGRQQKAIDFFMRLVNFDIPKICIENPIGIMSIEYRKPDQIIHPWMFGNFGENETKSTCLWLKNLPKLKSVNPLPEPHNHSIFRMPPSETRSRDRAVTFRGIAEAMANQWG